MAVAELESIAILRKVKALDEFELDTPVNKGVLASIDALLNLKEGQRRHLENIITTIKAKVKASLEPAVLPRLQQNLHLFRAYEIPKLAEDLPSSCQDLILWQCVVDIILEEELTKLETTTIHHSEKTRRKLSPVEQNAIRYTAGSVIRKLLDKYKLNTSLTKVLNGMLKDEIDDDDTTEIWLGSVDRGSLLYITDSVLEVFIEIETLVYSHLIDEDYEDMDSLQSSICEDDNVQRAWAVCVDTVDTQQPLLVDIVKEWINYRGHSIAKMELEKYKKKKSITIKKKRSLRKELQRKS